MIRRGTGPAAARLLCATRLSGPSPVRLLCATLPGLSAWLLCATLLSVPIPARAQPCPDPGTVIFPGLGGAELLDSLRVRYRPPVTLSYASARDQMYSRIDNHNGILTGVYTGYQAAVDPQSPTPRADAFARGINAEHTWPQSKGAGSPPMEGDMHHLFPSRIEANAARANHPFDEISDEETDRWFRLNQEVTAPVPALIDEYSELDNVNQNPGYDGRWEPREVHKGNAARAMFYFYAVYRNEANAADPNFFNVQKDMLRLWNAEDPPDSGEWVRTCAIAPFQGGRVNPFVIDPTLVDRAWFGGVPVVLAYLDAGPVDGGVRLVWRTAAEEDHLGFHVWRRGPGESGERRTEDLVRGGPEYRFTDTDVREGIRYAYEIESISRSGASERFGPVFVTVPAAGRLDAAVAPNPASGAVRVHFRLPEAAVVRLSVFDTAGRRVRSGIEAPLPAGKHDLAWDGALDDGGPAPAGLYFYRIEAGSFATVGRIVLTR